MTKPLNKRMNPWQAFQLILLFATTSHALSTPAKGDQSTRNDYDGSYYPDDPDFFRTSSTVATPPVIRDSQGTDTVQPLIPKPDPNFPIYQ
ncbi:uncharacterized protein [Macrobrachium rosenbergii]|uniref:uncharacterized protein isoform X2 n=1 Tax=Macrobrachium rosenbergii TaxID=79674 RepID=UPI0034D4C447